MVSTSAILQKWPPTVFYWCCSSTNGYNSKFYSKKKNVCCHHFLWCSLESESYLATFFFFWILYSFICNTWSPEYKHVVHVLQVIFSCAGLNKAEPYLCTLDSSVEITPSFMVMYVAAQLFSVLALYSLWEGIFPSSLHLDTVRTPGILRWVKCQKCFYIRDHWYLSYWCLIIYYRLVGLLTWLFL